MAAGTSPGAIYDGTVPHQSTEGNNREDASFVLSRCVATHPVVVGFSGSQCRFCGSSLKFHVQLLRMSRPKSLQGWIGARFRVTSIELVLRACTAKRRLIWVRV